MPILIAGGLIAVMVVMLASLILIAWGMANLESKARGLPFGVGNPLADLINNFIDLNKQAAAFWYSHLVSPIVSATRNLVGWIGQAVHSVITDAQYAGQLIKDIIALGVMPIILPQIARIDGILGYINTVAIPNLTSLNTMVNTFANQMAGVLGYIDRVSIPSFLQLSTQIDGLLGYVNGIAIPLFRTLETQINGILGAINTQIFPRVQALENEFSILITKPVTGALDRIRGLEGTIRQILPIWGTLALTIPLAQTLARVAKDPCFCFHDGGLADNGTLELAALMDLL